MADPRQLLKQSWDKLDSEQREELQGLAMDLWVQTLNASKGQLVKGVFECRGCQKQNLVEVPVEVPDILTRAKAFAILADQGYGKPEESKRHVFELGARTLEELRALPSSELAAWIESEPVEAEWAELPPSAA